MTFTLQCWQCQNHFPIMDPRRQPYDAIRCPACNAEWLLPGERPPELTGWVFRTQEDKHGFWVEPEAEESAQDAIASDPGISYHAVSRNTLSAGDIALLQQLLAEEERRSIDHTRQVQRLALQMISRMLDGEDEEEEAE